MTYCKMIRYLEHEQIDKVKWDECIKRSFNTLIYACSWYLDIVASGWDALIENDYERVMPLTHAYKLGTSYLFQPPFTQQLGVFSRKELNPGIIDNFINAIPPKFRLTEINLNSNNKPGINSRYASSYCNYELDLIRPYEIIYSGFSENRKRNIKKAVQVPVTIRKNLGPDEVINLYNSNQAKKYKPVVETELLILKRLIYAALYKGSAEIYGAYTADNTLCAGAIFMVNGNRAIFIFSGYNERAVENHAMSLLIDRFIAEHAPAPLTLDFEGSNNPGLARFYAGFGSTECAYPHLYINRFGFFKRMMFKAYKRFIKK